MKISKDDLTLISNTIKCISMDAVQKANSGHPGLPMGCSDIAAVLWTKVLRHNSADPKWANRDRFILSAGHGSMLLYSMLHLTGYAVSMEDLKNFRQFKSITPGHPEFGHTPGVETTTGPLGQGFANGVGMAIARELAAAEFNSADAAIIDHNIFAIVSDGDIMEGISTEAASLAGHLGLGSIIYIYDSNSISIEGDTDLAFSEDVAMKFSALGWHVQKINGHDFDAIERGVAAGRMERARPSLIIAETKIAKGSPNKEGSEESHGAPLGEDEVTATKKNLSMACIEKFHVNERVYEIFNGINALHREEYGQWKSVFDKAMESGLRKKWDAFFSKPDIAILREKLPVFDPSKAIATRSASGKVLESLFKELPGFIGGSADLAPSNKTFVKGFGSTGKRKIGRNIHFGIREHSMGAIQNGIAYYGGFIPFSATFLVFMDYMRPPIRIAALSRLHTIYVFTHDSFFVGEDGPTHQPVEHLAAARAIPNLVVIRPADGEETKEAWLAAVGRNDGPVMLALTRQDLPILRKAGPSGAAELHKGAYIIHEPEKSPVITILSSGSEVHISVAAAEKLQAHGISARVVSFPSWELFDKQDEEYRKIILPAGMRYAVVEAGIKMGWEKYAGGDAVYITMENFGMSAPANVLAEHLGFTTENIVSRIIAAKS